MTDPTGVALFPGVAILGQRNPTNGRDCVKTEIKTAGTRPLFGDKYAGCQVEELE